MMKKTKAHLIEICEKKYVKYVQKMNHKLKKFNFNPKNVVKEHILMSQFKIGGIDKN